MSVEHSTLREYGTEKLLIFFFHRFAVVAVTRKKAQFADTRTHVVNIPAHRRVNICFMIDDEREEKMRLTGTRTRTIGEKKKLNDNGVHVMKQ